MRFLRFGAYALSVILGLLGLLYLLSTGSAQNPNPVGKAIIGVLLLLFSVGIFYFALKKAPDIVKRIEITQKVDLAGDTELEKMTCRSCGATLEENAVKVGADGVVIVSCTFCGTTYQITEKPKW